MDAQVSSSTSKVGPAPPASPTRLAAINMLLSVAQTVVIAVFGYALTGRIDLALKERQTSVQERQANVQALEKMSTLLTQINDEKINDEMRERIVLQVAMYGSDAIYPLFVMAVSKNAYSPGTAIQGLRLLAVRHRPEVCVLLVNAQRTPKSINEIRKKRIEELVSDLECGKAEVGS